ncbi:hypothetical protein [Flavitalea sp.]|nr:hypothetical protein [Flavitalea sp.]
MKGASAIIFVFTLLYCFNPAMARQSGDGSRVSDINLPSISTSFISAATSFNRPRQIENATCHTNFACLAEIITIPARPYMVTGSRIYAGQPFAPIICQLNDLSSGHNGRMQAAFNHPLHHYHIVFPHHHFW